VTLITPPPTFTDGDDRWCELLRTRVRIYYIVVLKMCCYYCDYITRYLPFILVLCTFHSVTDWWYSGCDVGGHLIYCGGFPVGGP